MNVYIWIGGGIFTQRNAFWGSGIQIIKDKRKLLHCPQLGHKVTLPVHKMDVALGPNVKSFKAATNWMAGKEVWL